MIKQDSLFFVVCGYELFGYQLLTISTFTQTVPCRTPLRGQSSTCHVLFLCCRWVVLDTETRDLVSVHTDGNEIISDVKYSPGTAGQH